MKIPVLKKNNKFYIQLPEELSNSSSLELFPLKEGYYLITTELKTPKPKNNQFTLEDELAIVSKLMSLKFSERTPSRVSKLLTSGEKAVFDSLMKKKHIWVFKGTKKYRGEGVYNISNKLFSLWKEHKSKKLPVSSLLSILQKDGFMIISDLRDARKFSDEVKDKTALGQVLGVRGFDKKYYVATRNYYIKLRNQISKSLKEPLTVAAISELCNAPTDACTIVLKLMSEQGEVIEKRKDVYSLI